MRKIIFLLICITNVLGLWADDKINFVAEAPEVVVSGDQFRLSFTVNTQKVKDFRAPSINNFEILMGPSRSTQYSNYNGVVTNSITFTYILMADKVGEFTIPGATIVADGNPYVSNSVKVKVLPQDQSNNQSGNGSTSSNINSKGQISNKELFITATASKTNVYEQEAFLLTYKIYTQVNLTGLKGDMPDLKGCHTQEVELPRQKQWTLEHYNGRNYNTTVYSQYVLFPQQAGKLEIPSITFEGVVTEVIPSNDPFDFFNGGSRRDIKKNIVTPKLTINVKELPDGKPANFSGGVGEFSLSSTINTTELKTNDAVTVQLVISGSGNMKLINTPDVAFPQDFEIYDPKVDNKFTLTRDGLTGNKVIEYLAIPRHAGEYVIPPVEFSFFNIKTQQYQTLKTESYTLNIAKGDGNSEQVVANFSNKEDLKVLGKDIRYIKTGNTALKPKNEYFYGTLIYWLCYFVPLLLFITFMLIYRRQAIENSNVAKVRTKKANKVATKRMKNAGRLLAENKNEAFYDEVLKALWGYISDKLSISVSKLSKDNIEEELIKYGVADELISQFISTLNECEFARYAPGSQSDAMDKVYSSAVDVISKMENSIKR